MEKPSYTTSTYVSFNTVTVLCNLFVYSLIPVTRIRHGVKSRYFVSIYIKNVLVLFFFRFEGTFVTSLTKILDSTRIFVCIYIKKFRPGKEGVGNGKCLIRDMYIGKDLSYSNLN